MSAPLPPETSDPSDIPEAVKRRMAFENGTGTAPPDQAAKKSTRHKRATGIPAMVPARDPVQVTIDGTEFNLVLPCHGVEVQNVPGQETESLILVTDNQSRVRFTPKVGCNFRITQPAGGFTFDVTFTGFTFPIDGKVIHAFVINNKAAITGYQS